MWYLRRMGTSRSESLLTKSTFFSSFASWCFSLRTILQRRHCHTQVVRRARVSRDGVMRTIAQTLQRVEECGHAQNLTQPQQLECARPEHAAEVITTLACGHEPSLPHQDSCWLELRRRLIAHSAAQPTSKSTWQERLAWLLRVFTTAVCRHHKRKQWPGRQLAPDRQQLPTRAVARLFARNPTTPVARDC